MKKEESPMLTGLQIYHNYVRPHMDLDGKTPAEAAGIKVEGQDKVDDGNPERRPSSHSTSKQNINHS